jgi:hypothetical protein
MNRRIPPVLWLGLAFVLLGRASGAVRAEVAPALAIQELALTDTETSWHARPAWAPGQTVYVRLLLVGLKRDAQGRIRVRESLQLRDAGGALLLEAPDLLKLDRVVPDELSSIELVDHFVVPEGLAAGSYQAHLRCVDDVAGATADGDLDLAVGEASGAGLRISEFSLLPAGAAGTQGEDGAANLEARLVGYRLDADGRYWIEADVVLIDPSGQLALRWDKVLDRRERTDPMGLPLKLSVRLEVPGSFAAGAYRLELRVRDRLAAQEVVQNATWIKR